MNLMGKGRNPHSFVTVSSKGLTREWQKDKTTLSWYCLLVPHLQDIWNHTISVSGSCHLTAPNRVLFFDIVYLFDLTYTFCLWLLLSNKNFLWFSLYVLSYHFIWCLPHPELCETSNNCFPFIFSLAFRMLYSFVSIACSVESFPDWSVLLYLNSSYLLVIPFILLCTVFTVSCLIWCCHNSKKH